jgi:hypothetical protein
MAGTSSRTATASSRGVVGRQLQAKPRPEAHEPHRRRPFGGREVHKTRSPMPPGSGGRRCGGYVGRRSRVLPWEVCRSAERLAMPRGVAMDWQKSAEAVLVAVQGDEGPNTREPSW